MIATLDTGLNLVQRTRRRARHPAPPSVASRARNTSRRRESVAGGLGFCSPAHWATAARSGPYAVAWAALSAWKRGAGHGHSALGAPHRGADGEEADVFQCRQGGARARAAADGRARGAAGGGGVVRGARLRARGGGLVSLSTLSARVTRKSRSNFYYAFLTLPSPRREALYAVYSFCARWTTSPTSAATRRRSGAISPSGAEEVARCYEPGPSPLCPSRASRGGGARIRVPRRAGSDHRGCEMDLRRTAYETREDLYPSATASPPPSASAASRSSGTRTRGPASTPSLGMARCSSRTSSVTSAPTLRRAGLPGRKTCASSASPWRTWWRGGIRRRSRA